MTVYEFIKEMRKQKFYIFINGREDVTKGKSINVEEIEDYTEQRKAVLNALDKKVSHVDTRGAIWVIDCEQ